MKKKRPSLLLFLSLGLCWSAGAFSKDESATVSASITAAAAMQLAMLSEKAPAETDSDLAATTEQTEAGSSNHQADDNHRLLHNESTLTAHFSDTQLAQLRQLFLQAEEALKKTDEKNYQLLAEQLKEYPLYPYLQYQWLKKNLHRERDIKYFLEEHQSSRYAGLLQRKWLYHLASNRQWQTFLSFYSSSSDTSLQCYYRQAQLHNGDKQVALNAAKELWAVGYSQPKACDPLFAELKKSSLYDQQLLWQRFDAALRNNKTSLAIYVKKQMAADHQHTAQLWLNIHRQPQHYLQQLLKHTDTAQSPLIFRHAIHRLAGNDINQAISLWDQNKHNFALDKKDADKLEKQLAFKLALRNESGAYERLGQLTAADSSTRGWRVRVALYEQNWPRVITAIEELSPDDQNSEKWQYWLARAYLKVGRTEEAEKLLSALAVKRDFYGYLAADRMNSLYQLADRPVEVSSQEIEDIKNRTAFRIAFEFMVLDRENEAKLQWWHALRQLKDDEIIAAAKLAQKWQWDEIAIFTIAKVQYWDDVELRFPLSYADNIHENAIEQNLNPAIIFGLVRRESAFNKNARSSTGAQGLMQIMPQTGRQIARDLNERWVGNNSLYNPIKNLKYGSFYYQKLLNQFDGHYALALAAYNAGPNRVKQWLPDETIPADIWIETIPYHETRDYVTSVLAYTLIYQQRTQSSEKLTMNDFTRDIGPSVLTR